MSYSSNQNLFRQILMDHTQNPRNKGLLEEAGYVTCHLKNPSCGDDITVQVKLDADGQRLDDVRQAGSGCSICCSSTSMMTELLKAATVSEAEYLIEQFKNMVTAEAYDEEALGEAIALQGVARLQPRVKCATLGWLAAEQAIDEANSQEGKESPDND